MSDRRYRKIVVFEYDGSSGYENSLSSLNRELAYMFRGTTWKKPTMYAYHSIEELQAAIDSGKLRELNTVETTLTIRHSADAPVSTLMNSVLHTDGVVEVKKVNNV